jgi:hypothetical protein
LTKLLDSIIAYSLVNAESNHGTTVRWGDYWTIVDSSEKMWGIHSDGGITVNDGWEEDYVQNENREAYYTALLLYWNHTVYCRDYDYPHKWWKWTTDIWELAHDPRPSSTSTVAAGWTLPPSTGRYESLSRKIILYPVNH